MDVQAAAARLLQEAVATLDANPALRDQISQVRRRFEQTIDTTSKDSVLEAGFSEAARERAHTLVTSFEQFLRDNRDEITALQVLYSRPYAERLRFADIKVLARAIEAPPRAWTPELLWHAYETLDRSRVRGSGGRMLTDIVALVRFALHQNETLSPYAEQVDARFAAWLAEQEREGRRFTDEQRWWLGAIKDHIAASLAIDSDAFDETPFAQHGGLGRVYQLFGDALEPLLQELNQVLAA